MDLMAEMNIRHRRFKQGFRFYQLMRVQEHVESDLGDRARLGFDEGSRTALVDHPRRDTQSYKKYGPSLSFDKVSKKQLRKTRT